MIYTSMLYTRKRRLILFSTIMLLLVIILSLATFNLRAKQSLNVLLISIDTLRPDHMGVYGYKKNTTPNIDKWSKDAIVFTNVTTVVPMTQPSFAALLTGRNPLNTRIITNLGLPVSSNTKTLASILKEYDFTTAAFTPGFLAVDTNGLNQGFDENKNYRFKYFYYDQNKQERYKQTDTKGYEDFVNESMNWLELNKNNQFFFWVHLLDPHNPY